MNWQLSNCLVRRCTFKHEVRFTRQKSSRRFFDEVISRLQAEESNNLLFAFLDEIWAFHEVTLALLRRSDVVGELNLNFEFHYDDF